MYLKKKTQTTHLIRKDIGVERLGGEVVVVDVGGTVKSSLLIQMASSVVRDRDTVVVL